MAAAPAILKRACRLKKVLLGDVIKWYEAGDDVIVIVRQGHKHIIPKADLPASEPKPKTTTRRRKAEPKK
jgi:hypothetical protein